MYFTSNMFLYNLTLSIHIMAIAGLSGIALEDVYLLVRIVGGPYEVT